MTTGVAVRDWGVAADSWVSYEPSFTGGKKVWAAKGSLWTGAGSAAHLAQFRLWTLGKGKRPKIEKPDSEEDSAKLEIVQVKPKDGLYLWINDAIPEFIDRQFFAVGSGGGYAIGALSKGASPQEAIEIASSWNSATRPPVHVLTFDDIKRRGK